jgi:uncharacterized protein
MKTIKIGNVSMPLDDFIVSRNAALGITKSGKTYLCKGLAEQLIEHGVPIIVFDAIGMWRFLKVASGKPGGKGFPVVVAGGAEPDLPLTPHTAPQIVRAAIQQNISLVIDLYDPKLSKADWRRIVQDCFRILLFENKGLRHIFLEEAAEYVPQKVMDGQTYAEVEKLARMGGNASLGITFINPRAQELNKSVLELCDNIILLRQRGTHAIDSLERQMEKLSPEMAKEVALTMPNMTQGDCWVFTENGDEPKRTRSTQLKSFHPDRRNPEANKVIGAAVNTESFVKALSGNLEKVIADAKANDPAELKRKLAQMQIELKKAQGMTPAPAKAGKTQIKEIPALTDAERKRLTALIDSYERLETVCTRIEGMAEEIKRDAFTNRAEVTFFKTLISGKLSATPLRAGVRQPVCLTAKPATVIRRPLPTQSARVETNGESPTGGLRRMLIALAQRPGLSARQLGVRAGLSSRSGSFNTYLSKGRSCGWLIGDRNRMEATTEGIEAIGGYEPLPEGQELLQHWLNELGNGGSGRILKALADVHPHSLTKEELGAATALSENSGSFNTYLSKLRTLELIEGSNPLKASDEFFQ